LNEHYWGNKQLPVKMSWCLESVWQAVGGYKRKSEEAVAIGSLADTPVLGISDDGQVVLEQEAPAFAAEIEEGNNAILEAAVTQDEEPDIPIKHLSYKVRGDGFKMFVLSVTSRDTVQAACKQILNIVAPGASLAEASVELRFRHLERGIMLRFVRNTINFCSVISCQTGLFCMQV
jgi:hypothetical protein